jgi:hypothetical protein
LLTGCATMGIHVDYDTSANFAELKTYQWMPRAKPSVSDPRVDNALLESRIRTAVDEELAAKGFAKATSGSPDFLVGYHAAVRSRMDVYAMNDYYGYRHGWGWGTSDVHVYQYEEGTLALDVVEPETKRLIWRGSAQAEVNRSATPEKREGRIQEAVRKILERFPPQ